MPAASGEKSACKAEISLNDFFSGADSPKEQSVH